MRVAVCNVHRLTRGGDSSVFVPFVLTRTFSTNVVVVVVVTAAEDIYN